MDFYGVSRILPRLDGFLPSFTATYLDLMISYLVLRFLSCFGVFFLPSFTDIDPVLQFFFYRSLT